MGAEICNDAIDNDGDGRADCADPDCSGVGQCPVCGSVENPMATPLALPDGLNSGAMCSTDVQCVGTMTPTGTPTPNCVAKECHASYNNTLHFIGFPQNATLTDPTKLLSVCVTIEHSWMRDLQMDLITPPDVGGTRHVVTLHAFVSRSGAEEYLGNANDSDSDANPVPGVGAEYCWTPAAAQTMMQGPTMPAPNGFADELVPGNYKSISPWGTFNGVTLNGDWTMRVTDLWQIDNGYMFKWSIKFDPSLVSDCSGPIIL